jgi:uncharacterized protein YegP (UPF0339 family)
MSALRVSVFMGADGEWYWRLRARNGRIVAVGGEGYTRRNDCLRAFKRFVLKMAA